MCREEDVGRLVSPESRGFNPKTSFFLASSMRTRVVTIASGEIYIRNGDFPKAEIDKVKK
jgi:hypothetical protein